MSLDTLARWRALLAELGALGGALAQAIQTDEIVAAIATTIRMRAVRAELGRVDVTRGRGDAAEAAAIGETASLTIDARMAEAMMQNWLDRPLPGDARLLASPLGVAVLAEALLPAVWDFESDLVILVGSELAPVAEVLGDLGQRRTILLGAGSTAAICVASPEEVTAAVRTLVPNPPSRLTLRAVHGTDPALVERMADAARDALSDLRIHRNTVRAFSRTWVEQGTANLPALARWPSVAALDGALANVPMVIVAPGPSLAKNVAQLRELKGTAIICAFSHSLKPVLAAGVVPDIVMTVDPQDVRYHFAGCDLSETCLVNAATVHPALFDLPARQFLTLSANCAIDDWMFDGLGEQAVVAGGGSVATSAFSLALRWGCDPIVFVGLDLSFPGGEYYVATSSDGRARAVVDQGGMMRVDGWSDGFHAMKAAGGPAAPSERVVELPGWDGGTVPSSFMFALFHRWFVETAKRVGTTSVYNCTEGGAFIAGMDHRPLAEVAPTLSTHVDIAAAIACAPADRAARAAKLDRHLMSYVIGLGRVRRLTAKARELIAAGDTGPRLERVERTLSRALAPLGFVSLLAQREVDRAHDIARRAGTTEDYLHASSALLATLAEVIDSLEPLFRRVSHARRA
jgi:6-hydroxymethylpterin diphosphokinase MptE-like protein